MTEVVRGEIVAELLAVLHDEHRTTADMMALVLTHPTATDDERTEVIAVLADELATMLPAVIDVRPTVTGLTLRQLQSLAAIYGVVARWDVTIQHPDRTLADVLKILPQDHVDLIVGFLGVGFGAG